MLFILVVGSLLGVFMYRHNEESLEAQEEANIDEGLLQEITYISGFYLRNSNLTYVSVSALIENGTLDDKYGDFKCYVFGGESTFDYIIDCDKADEILNTPTLVVNVKDENDITQLYTGIINNNTNISLKMLNPIVDGEDYFQGVYDASLNLITMDSDFNSSFVNNGEIYLYKYNHEFYRFKFWVDGIAPVIENGYMIVDNKPTVSYGDHTAYELKYIFIDKDSEDVPTYDYTSFGEVIFEFCFDVEKMVYVYAVDAAGNMSNITYIGNVSPSC